MESIYILLGEDIYGNVYQPAVVIGGSFVLVALALSLFLILQHLRSYNNPEEQKWIVAVIFMVPFYATESVRFYLSVCSFSGTFRKANGKQDVPVILFLLRLSQIISLSNPRLSLACDILRSCYEAFALYAFGSYLVACLGGERRTMELLENKSRKLLGKPLLEGGDENQGVQQQGSFSDFFARPSVIGEDLLNIERFGLVQYMILKTLCAFLASVLQLFGVYGDGIFKWDYGYPYITVIINFSQMWALYCLIQFYNVTHEKLQPIKPLAKFISFKAIVFATWWQGVAIALLSAFGALPKEGKLKTGLQDFLICIEMAFAAVAHVFVFSAEPYRFPLPTACEKQAKAEFPLNQSNKEILKVFERTESQVDSPGTSIRKSVQDIVIEGGHHVVEDVVLTINQAIGPVGKGVTKFQEAFHHRSESKEEESGLEFFNEEEIVVDNIGTHHV